MRLEYRMNAKNKRKSYVSQGCLYIYIYIYEFDRRACYIYVHTIQYDRLYPYPLLSLRSFQKFA